MYSHISIYLSPAFFKAAPHHIASEHHYSTCLPVKQEKNSRERALPQQAAEKNHVLVFMPLHCTSKANKQKPQRSYSSSPRYPVHPSVFILTSPLFTAASRTQLRRKITYFIDISVPWFPRREQFCLPSPQSYRQPCSPVLQTPQTLSWCWTQKENTTDNPTHRTHLPLIPFLTQRN